MDDKLTFEQHINTQVQKANSIMGLIRRTFTYLDNTIFSRLFKALVRPILEYAHVVWHPLHIKNKKIIENVLCRASKQVPCCKDLSYKERLTKLKIPCMIYRKLRGDQIEVYKMLNNHYDKEIDIPLRLSKITRGDASKPKLIKSKIHKDIRANFFSNRVVNFWNKLPSSVTSAPSIKSFERRLDSYWGHLDIIYDFDKCLDYERSNMNLNYAGTTTRTFQISKDDDLRIQELFSNMI